MNIKINTRVEKDLLGHKEIPAHCYYGVQTLRALENFNLSPNKRKRPLNTPYEFVL